VVLLIDYQHRWLNQDQNVVEAFQCFREQASGNANLDTNLLSAASHRLVMTEHRTPCHQLYFAICTREQGLKIAVMQKV